LYGQTDSSVTGRWTGSILIHGTHLNVVVNLTDGSTLSGTIDIPAQNAMGLTLTNGSRAGRNVSFAINGIPGDPTFVGLLSHGMDTIAGDFKQGGATYQFTIVRSGETETTIQRDTLKARLDRIRLKVAEAMEKLKVPGVGLAIVVDGEVVMAEGFGVRDLDSRTPVDSATTFMIGSASKAFTATIIGSLVDEGKLEWDGVVADYMDDFHLRDDYATRHVTVADLLSHVSGLPRHDLLWYSSRLSRRELYDRLRFLESSAELRERWQYQNLMFMVAGLLAEHQSGRPWEELLVERVLRPLNMTSTHASHAELLRTPNRATGYEVRGEAASRIVTSTPYRNIDAVGPAGSINSTARDMAQWLRFNLGDGTNNGESIVTTATLGTIHRPRVVIDGSSSEETETLFNLYAMGWMATSYRGELLVEHGGNIDGFSTQVSMLPERNIGVCVLANLGGSALPTAITRTAMDLLIGAPQRDWISAAEAQTEQIAEVISTQAREGAALVRVPGTNPSHRIADYAGTYRSSAYDSLVISVDDDNLTITSGIVVGALEHYHYDYFTIAASPSVVQGMLVQFHTSRTGRVESVSLPLEPAVEPIVFERVAPASMSSAIGLQPYAGVYTLAGIDITFRVEEGALVVEVPGQREYRLEAVAEDEFQLRGMKGYNVRFTLTDGIATEAVFIQPEGMFRAARKEVDQ